MTTDPESPSGSDPVLVGSDLQLSFGRTPALRGAGMSVHAGEMVAVMGSSGSGKSTLLHCLAGILTPSSGSVLHHGREITTMPDQQRSALRRDEFGFVFQFGQLVPELTVAENVALPLRLSGHRHADGRRRSALWMDKLGVSDVADHRPGEISGGQGQRAAVARALVADPEVVFADEPTGALDSIAGEQVMALLDETARESGTAVVLVTHESRVAAYADREVLIRDGAVRQQESVR
ncbi:putative ABC transport system ATP-binding protein [Saccharopolyspora lacisalsi]|uniref:Putative ABC transport system ATP-binding protein n=1 Tax=Halosaccharopolyspora lacisalsi TaxID=1000566 RepID=A0A839DRJ9_9PSEU|nr:ABC transporter ATP-binding protein [Halosaccharopolyspora lacisalsi]MBA8824612.1 putative ABC transport system ATP-binding protein [Halosaccharopolyspora lacisalsi]